ncbi:MAG: hypothetical protein QOK42_2733 [Frankiaceae bacterium]|jgi:hypothetical protein|nr:hypothetical protein [Frankiaceae bacterium]
MEVPGRPPPPREAVHQTRGQELHVAIVAHMSELAAHSVPPLPCLMRVAVAAAA